MNWILLLLILLGLLFVGFSFFLLKRHRLLHLAAAADTPAIRYRLGDVDMLNQVYPSSVSVPSVYMSQPAYQQLYGDLGKTIERFTGQSLQRDNIAFDSLHVSIEGKDVFVNFLSDDPSAAFYATQHPKFCAAGALALSGIQRCQQTAGCWHGGTEPYVFFLCLGQPLVNHKAVFLLHFPPTKALAAGDYFNAFTLQTVFRRFRAVGIPSIVPTVDVEPIAANFAAQDFPDPMTYFPDFIRAMLGVLLDPPTNASTTHTLPLIVMGAEPRTTWATLIGAEVNLLSVGTANVIGKQTAWIAGNHPNVTTYNCCPNDPQCKENDIVGTEKMDLLLACWTKQMMDNVEQDPTQVLQFCQNTWYPQNAQLACVQAKLDTSFDSDAMCKTLDTAQAYCAAHNNDPCSDPLTCSQ